MENQPRPDFEKGAKRGSTPFVLSPLVQPPPCTRMTAGNGPFPSGTQASSCRLSPPARLYSRAFLMPIFEAQLFREASGFLLTGVWPTLAATADVLFRGFGIFGFHLSTPRRTFSAVMLMPSATDNCLDQA